MPSRALLSRSDAAASIPDVCNLKVKFQALSDLQPPPTAPPLPPPYRLAELQTDDTYDSIEHRTTSTTTTWAVVGLTVSALMCLLLLASTLSCCLLTSMCPYYTGVWVSSLCLINCGLGAAALSTGSPRNWCVAHLAISVLSFASCVLLLVLSVVNWTDIGTRMPLVSDDFYRQHYRAQQQQRARHYSLSTVATVDNIDPPPDDLYCLLSTYNADRISYIYQTQEAFDFEACWTTYKLAITLNTLNLFFALYLVRLEMDDVEEVNMAEIATNMLNTWIEDLAAFAKHAKRVRIGQDDVRLLARRNQSLLQHISSECCESANESESKTEKLDKSELNLASSDMGLSSDMEIYP